MKNQKWLQQNYFVCRTHLLDHHVSYLITPGRTIFRRQHHTDGKPADWFMVNSVDTLKAAKMVAAQDFELWLAGESTAEPCRRETLTL